MLVCKTSLSLLWLKALDTFGNCQRPEFSLFTYKSRLKALDTFGNCQRPVFSLKTLDTFGNCQRPVFSLKTLDTFGNCQRPVFLTLCVPTVCIKKQTCRNVGSIAQENNERQPCCKRCVCFQMLSFSNTALHQRGVICDNVLYYQQLSVACYQIRFYANLHFG